MRSGNIMLSGKYLLIALLLSGCASAPYIPASIDSVDLRSRSQTQTSENISVTAAVLSPEETRTLFGLDLYDRGIQPVWLEIRNLGDSMIRYAPVGTDREYFSSQEVAYVHRSGFSKEAQRSMNLFFHQMSMQRRIPAGESRSGFVFTHTHAGTKGFNVDLFNGAGNGDTSFTFFIDVPGFESDHSEAYLVELYPPEEIQHLTAEEIRTALTDLERITTDQTTEHAGVPINAVVVSDPNSFLQVLIRSGWTEHPRPSGELALEADYFDGRIADVLFVKNERSSGERRELRIWLTPAREGETPIWVVQVLHFFSVGKGERELDADLDDATTFFLQDLWYGQGLAQYGWVRGPAAGTIDVPHRTFSGSEYFSSGAMVVVWLSGPPISMLEVQSLDWDAAPKGGRE